jgi:hypothetical protein
MTGDALLIAAASSGAGGGAVLRYAWALTRRSPGWNAAGWGLFALSLVCGWTGAGAWGASIAALFGMSMALLLLGYAAATAPLPTNAKASNRRVGALPEGGEPWRLGRRIGTLLMVMVAALIVALGLALATRGLLAWAGAGEANANVASFYVMPLAWALLAFLLLMEERRARQWRLLALTAVPGVVAVAAGMAA